MWKCPLCNKQNKDFDHLDEVLECEKCGLPKNLTTQDIKNRTPKVIEAERKLRELESENAEKINSNISINKTEVRVKKISETKCTCKACGNIWFYGMKDTFANVFDNLSTSVKGLEDTLMCPCCGGGGPSRKTIDFDKCPKCGSRAIEKENVIHEVAY